MASIFDRLVWEDLICYNTAISDFESKKLQWLPSEIIPTEEIGVSNYDRGHRLYGIFNWSDFFSPGALNSWCNGE